MAYRTGNIIISFMDVDDEPVPMSTEFNVSTHGYVSPDSPFRYAPARLKPSISIEKSIGCVFWNESGGVEFGNIDISIVGRGTDLVSTGTMVDWVEWAKDNPTPQAVFSFELSDRTLEHFATADAIGILFPDSQTIRVRLNTKHGQKLDQYINTYYSGVNDEIDGNPIPLLLGSPSLVQVLPTVLRDETVQRYDVADLPLVTGLSPSQYRAFDQGVVLFEDASPGFTVVDNGFELTANPNGKVCFGIAGLSTGGIEDPLETGAMLEGTWRVLRYVLFRAGIDVDTYFPAEIDWPLPQPGGTDAYYPFVHSMTPITARQILDKVTAPLGAWWYVDEMGMFTFGLIVAPEDQDFVARYTDQHTQGEISAQIDLAPGLSNRIAWGYRPGWYQQGELAGSVTGDFRTTLSVPWTYWETTETIPGLYAGALGVEAIEFLNAATGLTPLDLSYIQDEVDRWWADLYYTTRRFYTFTIPIYGTQALPNLGDSVLLQSDLFRLLTAQVAMLVRRIKMDIGGGLLTIEAWGGEYETDGPFTPLDFAADAIDEDEIELTWSDV